MTYEKEYQLKNGKACLVRSCAAEDGAEVLRSFLLTHGETDFLLTYPDETSFTAEQEAQFLADKAQSPNEAQLCAVVDGKIVGTAGVDAISGRDKMRHRAELGITVEKAHWSQGIGRALMQASIDCARAAGYMQLELQVVGENTAAIALYEKMGFAEFGRNPRAFRLRTGAWQECVHMRLELETTQN